ncbi:50S ribosomal protein L17 [Bdellovibrio sp. 22V]|uniref:50S ribosomal protein L17 n=1 Tax=Bdellovibrio TaxID=958 RepID=UPI0025434C71|nr:50S ribosomal protein L17 [Bdellovibrio sp. 22V]WII73278.1 50S ribosomal protein L17 [Bdellovibrio sp. 22V]
MSSHRRRVKHFDRKSGPRKALLRGLVTSLVEHGRITTTVDRAKEVRRHIEKAITLGKKGDLATTRLLMSRYPNKEAVATIMKDLAPRFKTRPGGYTRIIKIGRRPGDTAEMAFLEFVDYDFEAKGAAAEAKEAKAKAEPKAAKATATKAKKASTKLVAAKKKSVKKTQKKARAAARA